MQVQKKRIETIGFSEFIPKFKHGRRGEYFFQTHEHSRKARFGHFIAISEILMQTAPKWSGFDIFSIPHL